MEGGDWPDRFSPARISTPSVQYGVEQLWRCREPSTGASGQDYAEQPGERQPMRYVPNRYMLARRMPPSSQESEK